MNNEPTVTATLGDRIQSINLCGFDNKEELINFLLDELGDDVVLSQWEDVPQFLQCDKPEDLKDDLFDDFLPSGEDDRYLTLLYNDECVATYYEDVSSVKDAFYGRYEDPEDFVASILADMGVKIPDWVSVDFEKTWDANLCYEYDAVQPDEGGCYIFRK